MAGPYLNIVKQDFFDVHKERLKEHRVFIYQGVKYYFGKKGGLYYWNSKGTRVYIYFLSI